MAQWIRPDDSIIGVQPENGTDFSLEEVKKFLDGGYMEVVAIPPDRYMLVDEDGKQKKLPVNQVATSVALPVLRPGDYIVGPALVCKRTEIK